MNDHVLRPLEPLDLERAAVLHRQAFEPIGERPWTARELAELLASPGVAGLILAIERRGEGFALWRTVADEAELLTIAVETEYRGRGHGRALLDAAVRVLRRGGIQSLFLEVGLDNAAALTLYSQAGFVQVGRRANYYARHTGFADALVLRLTLIDDGW